MVMQESAVLADCLESLKHAAHRYQEASFECDTDSVRKTLQKIALDRCEQQAAVFSLMHQMGLYTTEAADKASVQQVKADYAQTLERMRSRREAAREEADARPSP